MTWLSLTLDALQQEDIDRVVRAAWHLARADGFLDWRGAVFRRPAQDGNSTLFFSPSARPLGVALGATSCARPNGVDLHLIAGERSAWDAYAEGAARASARQEALHLPRCQMSTDADPSSLTPL